jgi:hypothetical protein
MSVFHSILGRNTRRKSRGRLKSEIGFANLNLKCKFDICRFGWDIVGGAIEHV